MLDAMHLWRPDPADGNGNVFRCRECNAGLILEDGAASYQPPLFGVECREDAGPLPLTRYNRPEQFSLF